MTATLLAARTEAGLGAIPALETARAEMKLHRELRTQKRLDRQDAYQDYRMGARALVQERANARAEGRELYAPFQGQHAKEPNSGIRVVKGATGIVCGLLDFVTAFLDPAPAKPEGRVQEIIAERKRNQAIERMSKNLARNEPVPEHDVRSLTHHDIMHLRQRGEPYLRELVMEFDRKSLRYLHKDRERER